MHGRYIVEERPDGITIIDQHALHERLVYADLKRRRERQEVLKQPLLVPQTIDLSPAEFLKVMSLQAELAAFGVDVEEFGRRSVVVRAVPQALGQCDPVELLKDLLAALEQMEAGRAADSPADAILKVMACKGAVKAGQRLSPDQVAALLDRRDAAEGAATCPHGRPAAVFFSLAALDKQFARR
jgi:DNA mismatch repair protein MutL